MAKKKKAAGRSEPASSSTQQETGPEPQDDSAPDARNASSRNAPRGAADASAGGAADEGAERLTTMICINCGAEQFFTDDVPDALTCERCKGTVFRSFTTPLARDEAAIAALEEQARSVSYGDPSPSTTPDEIRDLGR